MEKIELICPKCSAKVDINEEQTRVMKNRPVSNAPTVDMKLS